MRSDRFGGTPHDHNLKQEQGITVSCRIDQYDDGDPIEWTHGHFRARLPEMLEFAGAGELAEQVPGSYSEVLAIVDDVGELLGRARLKALFDRGL